MGAHPSYAGESSFLKVSCHCHSKTLILNVYSQDFSKEEDDEYDDEEYRTTEDQRSHVDQVTDSVTMLRF